MLVTAPGLTVHAYGTYQKNPSEGGGPMSRRDGSLVEYVELVDPDSVSMEGGVRRFTLDPSINGGRPEVGAVVTVTLRDWCEPDAKVSPRTQRAYIASKRRNVAVAFHAEK